MITSCQKINSHSQTFFCGFDHDVNPRGFFDQASASKSSIQRFVITEKVLTRAFSWLKAATTALTFKTLLRHYAKGLLRDYEPSDRTFWSTNPRGFCDQAEVGRRTSQGPAAQLPNTSHLTTYSVPDYDLIAVNEKIRSEKTINSYILASYGIKILWWKSNGDHKIIEEMAL